MFTDCPQTILPVCVMQWIYYNSIWNAYAVEWNNSRKLCVNKSWEGNPSKLKCQQLHCCILFLVLTSVGVIGNRFGINSTGNISTLQNCRLNLLNCIHNKRENVFYDNKNDDYLRAQQVCFVTPALANFISVSYFFLENHLKENLISDVKYKISNMKEM